MSPEPVISVVMPCLNEALTVVQCIDEASVALTSANIPFEVIIADNGSTDGSQALAREAGARVVDVAIPGYGAALMGGFNAARGKYVLMADADMSYCFSDAPKFVQKLKEGYDLVLGNRFLGGIHKGAMPFLHKYLGNPVLSFIGKLFFKTPVGDFHCGLRGFDRQRMLDLNLASTGMEFASEMILRCALYKYKMTELPTELRPDGRDRRPHLRTWRDGWRHLKLLLLYCPLWLFLIPGATLFLAGFSLMLPLLAGPLSVGGITLDVHTLIYAALFQTIGVEVLSLGAFARGYAASHGLRPNAERKPIFSLESGIIFGVLLVLLGVGGTIFAMMKWSDSQFTFLDPIESLRLVVPSALAITFGFQSIFLSFAMGVMALGGQKQRP